MIYCKIQNALVTCIKEGKIEDQVKQVAPFYRGDIVKEKMTSSKTVLGVMINARTIAIDSVILFFNKIYLSDKKLLLSEVVILS